MSDLLLLSPLQKKTGEYKCCRMPS